MKSDNYVSLRGTVDYAYTATESESSFNMENKDVSIGVVINKLINISVGDEVVVRGKLRWLSLYAPDEYTCIEAEYVENKTIGTKWWAKK